MNDVLIAKRGALTLVFVHGFNVTDNGARSIDRMAEELAALGYATDTDGADYGYFGLMMIRFAKWSRYRKNVYSRLAKAFENADVILTHSNGALFSTETLYNMDHPMGKKRVLFNYSAALDRDTPIPHSITKQINFCTRNDWVVKLAALIPFYQWGAMGAYGYTGRGPNTNYFFNHIKRHSGWFSDEHRRRVAMDTDSVIRDNFKGHFL